MTTSHDLGPPPRERHLDDVGNVILFEHVNVTVPDLHLAELFFSHALGLTRDPYIELGPDLSWFNVGRQQFHVPIGPPQVVRGVVDVVTLDLDALERRCARLEERFAGTSFGVDRTEDAVLATGPWGNRLRLRAPSSDNPMQLGISGVTFDVPVGASAGIGRFYSHYLGAPSRSTDGRCEVTVGVGQSLSFVETPETVAYDGHHIAIYIADFSGPYTRLRDDGLLIADSREHEYRVTSIVDPESGDEVFELEHEVRSLYNPLYGRPLVNKNTAQNLMRYVPGADAFTPRD